MLHRPLLALALAALLALAAHAGVSKNVHFKPGTSGATIKGAVVRGDEDAYFLGAARGQKMKVKIHSVESNAVFHVENPDGSHARGAGPADDATFWEGTLPQDGDYLITVGPTRGNATYTLQVEIR